MGHHGFTRGTRIALLLGSLALMFVGTPWHHAVAAASAAPSAKVVPLSGSGDGCNPNRTNDYRTFRFDGWYRTPGGAVGGVYSNIWNYSPFVYPISSTASYVVAWTMLTNSNPNDWAQVGWFENPYGVRYTFIQTYDGSGSPNTEFFAPEATNTYTTYTMLYGNTPGGFTYEWAGNVRQSFATFVPNQGQIFGETHTLADQMPGGYSNPYYYENFYNSHIYYSGGWRAYSGTVTDYSSDYGYQVDSSYNMDIWDKACPD